MRTFLLATEGVTDFDALREIIEYIAARAGIPCQCRRVFPLDDATTGRLGKGGWSRLMDWAKTWNPAPRQDPGCSASDKALWAAVGIHPPTSSPPVTWASVRGIDDNTSLVFHLDGDIAGEIASHHPDGAYAPATDRASYCRKALSHWTGLSEGEALWAIPVQCLESWFLTLHPLELCQKKMPDMHCYESLPTSQVYELLCHLGHPHYVDEAGNYTVDKCALTEKHSTALAKQLDTLCQLCPSAARFTNDVRQHLQPA